MIIFACKEEFWFDGNMKSMRGDVSFNGRFLPYNSLMQVRLSLSRKKNVLFALIKAPFFFHLKNSFCLDFFVYLTKRLDKKAKVNFDL